MSESGAPISGRVIGTIAAEDVANGGMIVRTTGGTTFGVGSEVNVYLASAAKPAQPDPDTMSAEECEAELDAAEAVWICFRNYIMWQCHVVVGNQRLEQTVHVDWRTKERALRAAVRALREHQTAQPLT